VDRDAVRPAVERFARFVGEVVASRELARRDIGRVADDEIDDSVDRREQVALQHGDAIREPEARHVRAGGRNTWLGQIERPRAQFRHAPRKRAREVAGPAADVDHRRTVELRERRRGEELGLGSRDQGAGAELDVDAKEGHERHDRPVFLILPVVVRGSSSTISMNFGTMKFSSVAWQPFWIVFASSVTPGSSTTNAFTA
jgi:hypothetical protein